MTEKPTYRIILPYTRKDLLKSCLDSIDQEIRSNIIKVDNSEVNIGVARAWNIGVKYVLDNNIDFLIICSVSLVFNQGLRDLISKLKKSDSGYCTQHGWHLIALSKETLKACGLFDTNFYPAYYEDSDYVRRLEVLNIHQPLGKKQLPFVKVDGKALGNGLSMQGQKPVVVNYGAVREYFIQKWGDDPKYDSQESRDKLYKTPFNDPNLPIDYFVERSIDQLKRKYMI